MNVVDAKTRPVVIVCFLALCALGLLWVWLRSPRPPSSTYLYITPSIAPDLNPTERAQAVERLLAEMDQRVQRLYDSPNYRYGGEIVAPLFERAFPDAHLYVVAIISGGTGNRSLRYSTMASFEDKDYRMPDGFNQLMSDVGYSLNVEKLDDLARALVIAALPTEMITQPVACGRGREIDEVRSLGSCPDCLRFVYEIECQAVYESTNDIVVKLLKFNDRFSGGWIGWSSTTKTRHEQFGYFFSTD